MWNSRTPICTRESSPASGLDRHEVGDSRPPRDGHAQDRLREAGDGVPLEEALVAVTLGTADQGERPPTDVRQHPRGDLLIVARKVELGEPELGIHDPPGVADGDAADGHARSPTGRRRCGRRAGRRGRRHDWRFRLLGHHLIGRLVEPQSFEGRVPEGAAAVPVEVLDFGDKLRTHPRHARGSLAFRGVDERRGLLPQLVEPAAQFGHRPLVPARTDAAGVVQRAAAASW